MNWFTDLDLRPGLFDVWFTLGWIIIVGWALLRWGHRLAPKSLQQWLLPLFLVHVVAGLLLGYPARFVVSDHGDSVEVFRSARNLWLVSENHPDDLPHLIFRRWGTPADDSLITRYLYESGIRYQGQPLLSLVDNRQAWPMVLLAWLLLPLAGFCFYPLSLVGSALGAWGCLIFAMIILRRLPESATTQRALLAVLWLPSIIFWNSGLLKEPFVLFAMAAALAVVDAFFMPTASSLWRKPFTLVGTVLLIFLVFQTKPYPFVLWLVFLGVYANLKWMQRAAQPALPLAVLALGLTIVVAIAQHILPLALYEAATSRINLLLSSQRASGGAWMDIGNYPLTLWGAFLKLPAAWSAVFVLPWPWHISRISHLVLLSENILNLSMLGLALATWPRLASSFRAISCEPLVWLLIAFSLAYAAVLGLSVSNLGSIARYRAVVLPPLVSGLALAWALAHTAPLNASKS